MINRSAMQVFLGKVKVVSTIGTLDVESFESAEIVTGVQIMTQGWQFWKPAIGDIVVVLKTDQNQQLCLGTLHPNHPDWDELGPNTDGSNTNLRVIQEGHWSSRQKINVDGILLP